MYETVKTVNGMEITRRKGTRGYYTVTIRKEERFRIYRDFKTIKAAEEFIRSL